MKNVIRLLLIIHFASLGTNISSAQQFRFWEHNVDAIEGATLMVMRVGVCLEPIP